MLRSGDRPGLEQETWALLALYQLLRMAMTDAAAAVPGTDPDRASFTTALQTAADQLTAAQDITPPAGGYPGVIGRAVLATLLPARRPRYSARTTKQATPRYPGRTAAGPRPALPETITAIAITIYPPPPASRPRPATRLRRAPNPASRRVRVLALMTTSPHRTWTAAELAAQLHLPPRDLATQLGRWARNGLLTRTSPATYTLTTTPAPLTNPPDP